ncbi:GNAT family N-acetyltransferase [Loktanella sp. Alg231-35]|uniref:GNAT family N-acetyltransferase n=1 Tax=Loktanella sp. Alg231-35 TaxID=1922220 RepID=UPI000D562BB1|nr:GNAT family N-acetyltransferase [Loktanella sp. Alg231-35]
MQIKTIHEIQLTKDDDAAIGALLSRAFGQIGDDDFEGRSYYKQRHHLRVLGWEGDHLIGHIALNFRMVTLGDETLPIIGLAEVATHPDHGGKGVASALLEETIKLALDAQATFILLFGDHPIYTRRGFLPAQNELRYVGIEDGHINTVITQVTKHLKVMALRDQSWDDTAKLDLLGHIF